MEERRSESPSATAGVPDPEREGVDGGYCRFFRAKRGGTARVSLALGGHPRHLAVPPVGLIQSSLGRPFGFQTPRRALWSARLFHLWDQAGMAMKVHAARAQLLKSL